MKIAVVGCGMMGGALARHFAKSHSVVLCDRGMKKSQSLAREIGADAVERINDAVSDADIILLAVKPKNLADVAKATTASLSKKQILLSVLAGTPLAVLRKHFPEVSLVRMMPNLALMCGQGVIGLVEDPYLTPENKKLAQSILEGLGLLHWLAEEKVEALTALSASSPALVYVVLESMIESGISMGFTYSESEEFVLKTVEGAIALLRHSKKHPAELKIQIASPGGTTIAALKEIESTGVRAGIWSSVLAAYHRGLHMTDEFDGK